MSEQKNSLGMTEKTASWFAYILTVLSGIILLATEKENKTVRTHAWQSLVMGCFFIAVHIIISILTAIFMPNPITDPLAYLSAAAGAFSFFGLVSMLASIAWGILTIICIVKAVQGDIFKLPVIYNKVKDLK
ncbi:MAG: hypothetical protein WDA65_02205 [Christensenellales bacterium]